jgi:hypothetical protein
MPTPSAKRADLVLKFEYTLADRADPVAKELSRGQRDPEYAAKKEAFMAHRYNNRWGLDKGLGTRQQYGQVLSRFADFCDNRGDDYAVYPLDKVAEFIQETWGDVQRKDGTNPGQTMEHTRKALKAAMLGHVHPGALLAGGCNTGTRIVHRQNHTLPVLPWDLSCSLEPAAASVVPANSNITSRSFATHRAVPTLQSASCVTVAARPLNAGPGPQPHALS